MPTVDEIIQLVMLGTKMLNGYLDAVAKGKAVLSETDAAKIKAALAEAQAATNALRPRVDTALQAASQR